MAILRIENGLIMDDAVGGIPIERRIVEPGTEAHCVRTLAGLSGPVGCTLWGRICLWMRSALCRRCR